MNPTDETLRKLTTELNLFDMIAIEELTAALNDHTKALEAHTDALNNYSKPVFK
jgi:hypothetical protein